MESVKGGWLVDLLLFSGIVGMGSLIFVEKKDILCGQALSF